MPVVPVDLAELLENVDPNAGPGEDDPHAGPGEDEGYTDAWYDSLPREQRDFVTVRVGVFTDQRQAAPRRLQSPRAGAGAWADERRRIRQVVTNQVQDWLENRRGRLSADLGGLEGLEGLDGLEDAYVPPPKPLSSVENEIVCSGEQRLACELLDLLEDEVAGTGWPTTESDAICPLSLHVVKDPVVAADGITYERSFVHRFWATSRKITSPACGHVLYTTMLTPNLALKSLIFKWASRAADVVLSSFESSFDGEEPAVAKLREAARLVRMVRGIAPSSRDVGVQASAY